MFNKLFIRTKSIIINHWILSLCLGSAIASEILTGFAYFVPNIAKIISYVLLGITWVLALITFRLAVIYKRDDDNTKKVQHENTIFTFIVVCLFMLMLSCVIPMELGMFGGKALMSH